MLSVNPAGNGKNPEAITRRNIIRDRAQGALLPEHRSPQSQSENDGRAQGALLRNVMVRLQERISCAMAVGVGGDGMHALVVTIARKARSCPGIDPRNARAKMTVARKARSYGT